jgi:putative ABC transport system permease protein
VALILLTGSIVMLRGFVRLANVDPGFRTANILTAMVPPGPTARLTKEQLRQRYDQILELAQNVPGVEQAALTGYLPLGRVGVQLQMYLPNLSSATYQIDFHAVSLDYFQVMGIPLLQGRFFNRFIPAMDKGAVVINRTMAEQYWPGENAVGQRLSSRPAPATPDLTVVGVVGDTQHRSLGQAPVPEFYEDYHQYLGPAVGATLVLRTYADPRTVAASLRTAIHRFDPEQVVEREQTLTSMVEQTISAPRFYTALLSTFALLALMLTLIGVYGVASYGTSLRRREFAVRMALGAERHDLIGMVLQQGLLRATVGIGAGLLGAFALSHLLASLVYGVSVRDPVSFGMAAAVLAIGALLAYYLPARRSTKVDPAAVLREE